MTFEYFNTKFHRDRWKQKQPFSFCYCVDNFYPWKDIVGKKVSKLRSIAELRALVLREIYLWRNPKWVSSLLIKRLVNLHDDTSHMRDSTLIKNGNNFVSLIYKEIQTGSVAKSYISPYVRRPLDIQYMTLQPIPSKCPYLWGKFDFLFYQCT